MSIDTFLPQKMTEMRKAKEEELFKAFQTHQARICDKLQAESAQATGEEDRRIAQAVVEQEAKKWYTIDCVSNRSQYTVKQLF